MGIDFFLRLFLTWAPMSVCFWHGRLVEERSEVEVRDSGSYRREEEGAAIDEEVLLILLIDLHFDLGFCR